MSFKDFKLAVERQLQWMAELQLYQVEIDKDLLWETYLNSFPAGSNPIFRKRTEHDCSCCRQFVRNCGGLVTVVDNKLVSIWDINIGGAHQVVADAMAELVKGREIDNVFLHNEKRIGVDYNFQQLVGGDVLRFEHFYFELPARYFQKEPGSKLSETRSTFDVFQRGLQELSLDAANIVLEMIEQNSLYRGEEHKNAVVSFITSKREYDNAANKTLYAWDKSTDLGPAARFRNTAIGTLVVDISEGMELDAAVQRFESKVAPTNYKRSSAPITKSMIDNARNKIDELGYSDSLARRYATVNDLTINNILFADRQTRQAMNVFDEMVAEAPEKHRDLSKVEEVSIDVFINDILPTAKTIDVLVENHHEKNLMSVIAPANMNAKNLLKWGNNFSWSYNGDITDSIRERVKQAGGNVVGDLRCSLSWFNYDDLDLHVVEPNGFEISFRQKQNIHTGGCLDVDMNAPHSVKTRSPVENIAWPSKSKMREGTYHLYVNQFNQREPIDVGFVAEIEFGGNITTFHYDKKVSGNITVAKFRYSHANGIEIIESLPSSQAPKEVWGIQTQRFHRVAMLMLSPNFWDGQAVGNRHWFFVIDNCRNPIAARGLFNEFLNNELQEHRKVFEVLGSKMKAEYSDDQLSGLGFSSTQRNHAIVKVTSSFTRLLKVNF